jgi:putative aldouronate transport system substrate-binding protein
VLTTLTTYARDGVLLKLDGYLDRMPDYRKVIPQNSWYNVTVDGAVYALPKQPQNNMTALYVRKDWLDELNLKMPKSFDDWLSMGKAFLRADLDGNGAADTYSVGGRYGLECFGTIFSGYDVAGPGHVMIRDGKAVYASTLPQFREALVEIRRFVDAGIVDPELMTSGMAYREKMATGNLAMVYGRWADHKRWENLEMYKAIDPEMEWVTVPVFDGPYAPTGVLYDGAGYVRLYGVNADLADNERKLDGIFRIWDYVSSPEGNRLVMYGIEGVHYDIVEGQVVPTDRISEVSYSAGIQFTGRDNMSYLLTKFAYVKDDVLFCADEIPLMNYYNTLVVPPPSVNFADIKTYETEQLLAFVYGKKSMDEYDGFLKTLYDLYNLQDYIDAAQSTLEDMGYIR